MELNKEKWSKSDKEIFQNYLETFKNVERISWTKNILNTNMPVLAIKANILKDISKKILKGNYQSFLDLELNTYYENTYINGYIISQIKDFEIMKRYLDRYVISVDNWASIDVLKIRTKKKEKQFLELSKEYSKSKYIFQRRASIIILFDLIKTNVDDIFTIIKSLKKEKEYYVNMAISWLLCECFIKERDKTLLFLMDDNINDFVRQKTISKCRDSYRVSKDDKQLLLKYKTIKD